MKTSILYVGFVIALTQLAACGLKVESGKADPTVIPSPNQKLEEDLKKNPLLGKQFRGEFNSIQIDGNGGTQIGVRRTCDAGAQYCNFMGQPAQDNFVLDLGTPSGYSEKIENGQNVSISMTGTDQVFTLNEVLTANGTVVAAIIHVMIYSTAPCGSNVKGPGLEDRTQIKSYFEGGSSNSAGCQAMY